MFSWRNSPPLCSVSSSSCFMSCLSLGPRNEAPLSLPFGLISLQEACGLESSFQNIWSVGVSLFTTVKAPHSLLGPPCTGHPKYRCQVSFVLAKGGIEAMRPSSGETIQTKAGLSSP